MSQRRRFRSLLTIAYLNGVIPIRTQPLYLVNLLASPLSFLFFIYIVTGGTGFLYGVAGGMLLTILSNGTGLQTDISHYKQDLKWQDVVVATPVEAPIYVAGMALSELLYSLPGLALFVALWAVHGPLTLLGGLTVLGVLVVAWIFASALGFTLATYFSDVRETFAISPLISITLTVLPPVYYSLDKLPLWAQDVARILPTTYAAQLVHAGFGLESISLATAALDWAVLGAFAAGLLLLSSAKARWREP